MAQLTVDLPQGNSDEAEICTMREAEGAVPVCSFCLGEGNSSCSEQISKSEVIFRKLQCGATLCISCLLTMKEENGYYIKCTSDSCRYKCNCHN